MEAFKIGIVQMACDEDKNKNIEKAIGFIEQAAGRGARIVCLQEVFNTIYFPQYLDMKYMRLAETVNGPTVQKMSVVAKEKGIYLILPFFEVENKTYYNSAVVLNPDGAILGKYRKNHIPHNSGYQEKYYFRPGNLGFPVFTTPYCKFGVSICWDHWFTETQRAYGVQGCDIVFSPTALGYCDFDNAHIDKDYMKTWETMIKGQCIQNGIFMAVAHRTGTEDKIHFFGGSLVCNIKGEIIARLGEEEGVLVTDVDISECYEWHKHQRFFRDRRNSKYYIVD